MEILLVYFCEMFYQLLNQGNYYEISASTLFHASVISLETNMVATTTFYTKGSESTAFRARLLKKESICLKRYTHLWAGISK